jgi:carbamoyltransferase
VSTVVGIHDGHNASVAVLRNGRLVLALQEERLTRVKNQGDLPRLAVRTAMELVNGDLATTGVALDGRYMNYGQWSRAAIEGDYRRASTLASRLRQRLKGTWVDRRYQAGRARRREDEVASLGFGREQIQAVEHHTAHASAAYHTCPWPDEKVLVLTCDGSGDRLSATVSIGEKGELRRIAEVSEHDSIGRLYAVITQLLGMAPQEHEYKVMGLAPYVSDPARCRAAARRFRDLFEFPRNCLAWRRRPGVPSMYAAHEFVGRLIAGERFDLIAAGAQRFLEQMLVTWVGRAVRETGLHKLACAGGVFMNVKANLALLELDEVEDLFIFPSCGDESNSIGAACHVAARMGERIEPLRGLYFGESISDADADQALTAAGRKHRLKTRYVPEIEAWTAEQLAGGKIVARAKGPMEFGARALGNRSILARADAPGAVRVINEMIKNRDFWMPFAPSVLAERAADYYDKPKPVASPYMMLAFHSRPETRARFEAAQHWYDFTARPQEVFPEHNPDYFRLLKHYEERTGEGILLNTSFNLHGEPIVCGARDALDVFLRSGLTAMALGNWWVEKS